MMPAPSNMLHIVYRSFLKKVLLRQPIKLFKKKKKSKICVVA